MSWADKTRQGLHDWFTVKPAPDQPSWGERLANWGMGMIAKGATKTLEDMEPGVLDAMKSTLATMKDDERMPPHMKAMLEKMLTPGNPLVVIGVVILGIFMIIPMIFSVMQPLGNLFTYAQERLFRSFRFDPESVIRLWRRDKALEPRLQGDLDDHGLTEERVGWLKTLTEQRLDPETIIRSWRRDKGTFEQWFTDLEHQGWTPERIEVLKFSTQVMPTPRDIVGFLAHEVFESDMIAKYGLLSEWDKIDKAFPEKIGLLEDILKLYWMDHWEHPQWGVIQELRHRDQITDQDVEDWFRIVEIPEYWRPKMLNVLWGLPNRIEIRMMVRYLDMSKAEVMDLLKNAGLHEDYRSDAADFMMVMGLQGLWASLYRNGWLNADELKTEIEAKGISSVIADRVYKRIVKEELPGKVAGERDLTKTDIYKGVKQGRITRLEGVELLMDIGYDESEAVYLLDINIPTDQEDEVVSIRQLTKSDIINGLKADVISEAQALEKLLEIRYSPTDAEFLLNIYRALKEPPADPKLKEASKADIVLAVKKGLITPEEGYLMLQDIDYSPEAAQFILEVKAETSPFSPVSFEEFKQLTTQWRMIMSPEIPPEEIEIKNAANELIRIKREVQALDEAVAEEEAKLAPDVELPPEATKRLKEIQVARNRAVAELSRKQKEFNARVAVWKHKGKAPETP